MCRSEARVLVRIVEYPVTGPQLEGYGRCRCLIADLPDLGPGEGRLPFLKCWGIELVTDVVDIHQRLVGRSLSGSLPIGVIHEL